VTTQETKVPTEAMKPCPFDQGKPFRHEADFEIVAAIAIGCQKCGALGPFIDVEGDSPTADDWQKAEQGWNTRASQSASPNTSEDVVERYRLQARDIVAKHYDYRVVENVSEHCAEVEFVLKGIQFALASPAPRDTLEDVLRKLDGYMAGALDCRVSAAGWQGIVEKWREEIAAALKDTQQAELTLGPDDLWRPDTQQAEGRKS
jgi:hypothetical protein